jgi:hypothetical protein
LLQGAPVGFEPCRDLPITRQVEEVLLSASAREQDPGLLEGLSDSGQEET